MTSICIGVPSYKRADLLKDLLDRLLPLLAERPHIRLCVVNDGSHDARYDEVVSARARQFDYRILPVNGGCGAARRACFEDAREDHLVCIDDDCLPTREWLDWLEAMIATWPGVDLFAGDVKPHFPEGATRWQKALSTVDEAHSALEMSFGLLTAVTANLAMKRSTYEAAGGFDAGLRGAEDCDITQKVIAAGGTYLIVHHWVIFHVAKLKTREMRKRFRQYGFATASYVVTRNAWKIVSRSDFGQLRPALRRARECLKNELAKKRRLGLPPVVQWQRAGVTTLLQLEYEYGWYKGMKAHGRSTSSPLPYQPKLIDRYRDFTEEDRAALALRSGA
ncbi:MAG: glycosyltransferase family A protein [Parvibaculum sp.]|nr:glycosyltransferase family A protein [Parvibaculum sp.]